MLWVAPIFEAFGVLLEKLLTIVNRGVLEASYALLRSRARTGRSNRQ